MDATKRLRCPRCGADWLTAADMKRNCKGGKRVEMLCRWCMRLDSWRRRGLDPLFGASTQNGRPRIVEAESHELREARLRIPSRDVYTPPWRAE